MTHKQIEAWWALVTRVLSFVGGMAIIFWQTILEDADRPWLIAAALTMMGLPIAQAVLGAVSAAGELPSKEERPQ